MTEILGANDAASVTYTVDGNETYTLSETLNLTKDTTITGNGVLTLTYAANTSSTMIIADNLTITGTVEVIIKLTKGSSLTDENNHDIHVFSNSEVSVANGASLVVSQDARTHGVTTYETTLNVDNATAEFKGTNGLQTITVNLSNKAVMKFTEPNAGVKTLANFKGTINNSSVTVTGATETTGLINLYNITVSDGSVIKTNGNVGLYEDQNINITGSTIEAEKVSITNRTTPTTNATTVTGGTINADIVVGEGIANPTLNMVNVTLAGNNSIANNVTVEFTGSSAIAAGSNITNNGTVTNTNTLNIQGSFTSGKGTTLTNSGTIAVAEKGKLSVGINVNGTITNDGTIFVTEKNITLPDNITGTGSVDTSAIASEGTISGDWNTKTPYGAEQTITLTGNTNLVSGAQIVIYGKLIIPEGMTLTIEKGAQLLIMKSTGYLENNGTILVESNMSGTVNSQTKNGALVIEYAEAVNNGNIVLDFSPTDANDPDADKWTMNASGRFVNNGTITVGENSKFGTWYYFENAVDGVLQINGSYELCNADTTHKFLNAGKVILDGKLLNDSKILMTDAGASVEVISFSGTADKKLVIDDSEIKNVPDKKVYTNDATNSITLTAKADYTLEGLVINSQTIRDSSVRTGVPAYFKQFDISGSLTRGYVGNATADESTIVSIETIGKVVVSGELSVGEYVEVSLKSTTVSEKKYGFEVSGTVTAVKKSTIKFADDNANIITVTGKMTIAAASEINQTNNMINAAMYTIAATTTTDKQYVYTTLATAVADGAKKIFLTGNNSLEADLTVPADTSVENKGTLTIKDEAKLSFDEKSVLKQNNAKIEVDGVLYIADVKGTKNPDTITSDVTIKGEKDITYCGIAYALNNAGEGDIVKLSNETHVENSVTIPAGVTLDTNEKGLCLHEGVVLTIDGTLYINRSNVDVEMTAGTLLDAPEIVLNGTVKSKDMEIADVVDSSLEIDGAYYEISDKSTVYYYAEPVATAAPKIATVDDGLMTLKGDLKVGDVTFAGTSDVAVKIVVEDSIIAGSITVNLGEIVFTAGETFDGVVTNGAGTVDIAGIAGAGFILTSKLIDDVDTLVISGAFEEYNGTEAENSVFTVSGTAALGKSNIESMVVDGTLNVIETGAAVDYIVINGTVNVANEKTVTFGVAEVFGTLAVADKTTEKSAGSAKIDELFIGLDYDDIVGAAGSVTGNITDLDYAVVGAGSTIGDDIVKDKAFTEYYVEDSLYMTVYNFANYTINYFDAVIENADFVSWVDEDGKDVPNSAAIGTPKKVDAKIEYDVYMVYILANVGVNDVSIDGNLMMSENNGYYAIVAAGKHTITYTLANGYTGTAKLAVNGAVPEGVECTLSGMEFDISGDIYSEVTLQLTGIEKSGYVPDSPDTDSGMTITDYLLIVLVVLIIVMAIIVAMRMMRS